MSYTLRLLRRVTSALRIPLSRLVWRVEALLRVNYPGEASGRSAGQESRVRDFKRQGVAIVIESGELVQTICDFLRSFGYKTISAPTHALAAERAIEHHKIALLAAAVPAPDESRAGIYLEEASKRNRNLAVVLMLSDPLEQSPGAPGSAVKIVKPFGYETLIEAIELSEIRALNS